MSTYIKSLQKEVFSIFTKAFFVLCCYQKLKLILNKIEITWKMNCFDTFVLSIVRFLDWNWNMSEGGRGRRKLRSEFVTGAGNNQKTRSRSWCNTEAPYFKLTPTQISLGSGSEWVESAGIRATKAAAELLSIILL